MKPNPLKSLLAAVALIGTATGLHAAESAIPTALVKRGAYLVERVGLCADCHSARNERGEIVRAAHLAGAALPFAPTVPMPVWSPTSPPIAGLPSLTSEQAVTYFTTGKRPDGSSSRPPMPEFRFDEDDARAVTAYLKSLGK
jgi:mono/diheme cytochrome c family protein